MPQHATSTSFNGPNANKRRPGVQRGDIRGPYKKKRSQLELQTLIAEQLDGAEQRAKEHGASMHSVPRDVKQGSVDPLDFMQQFIDNEGMPKRDRLLASAQLAPYRHARKCGQYIGRSVVLPEPTNVAMAQEQIASLARLAREGIITLEESTALIGHLKTYIDAAGVVELGPRIARLEAKEAMRAEQGAAHASLVIESSLPLLPGCESLITPDTKLIEEFHDEWRAGPEQSSPSFRVPDGSPPSEDQDNGGT
jgi:hypothetical protein